MYFYVFLQPEIFEEAAADGEDASQSLLGILNGFLQNCFLAVFEDDRWGEVVKEKLVDWPETMSRRRIMSLLVQFKKRNRFLYRISPDYSGQKSDLDCVFEQACMIPLDLVAVIDSECSRSAPVGIEIATRRTYQNTAFEAKRSDLAIYGKTCNPGEMAESAFMDFHFARALKYATEIHICDRVCGAKNFADNFHYTTKRFMLWLTNGLSNPAASTIIFHLGQPSGQGEAYIVTEIASLKKGPLSSARIEIHFYSEIPPNVTLPHQRFILTDQIALDLDRGMDFIDRKTGSCRDTYVNYQKPMDAQRLLKGCASGCISSHTV